MQIAPLTRRRRRSAGSRLGINGPAQSRGTRDRNNYALELLLQNVLHKTRSATGERIWKWCEMGALLSSAAEPNLASAIISIRSCAPRSV